MHRASLINETRRLARYTRWAYSTPLNMRIAYRQMIGYHYHAATCHHVGSRHGRIDFLDVRPRFDTRQKAPLYTSAAADTLLLADTRLMRRARNTRDEDRGHAERIALLARHGALVYDIERCRAIAF